MASASVVPAWLTIVKVSDRHYQLTDTSVESVGLCLGVFHSLEAAQSFAAKIAQSRAVQPVNTLRGALRLQRNTAPFASRLSQPANLGHV